MVYTWHATEILTGRIIGDLPDLAIGTVKRTLMKYDSAQGTLPGPTAPENWERILLPKASCLHLVDGNVPVWGGMTLDAERTSDDELPVSVATIEAYFADRYVGDETYTQVGQNLIVKDLVEKYAARGRNGGIPIRVVVLDGPGKLRNRTYTDQAGKTLYSALRELSGVIGGPEWTVEWEWLHDPERIVPVLYVGTRVGKAPAPGLDVAATFEMPGSVQSVSVLDTYKSGSGANDVMAYSTATGDEQPQSQHVVTKDPERPTIEYRWSPSSSITDTNTLDDHATAKAHEMAGGARVISLTSTVAGAPRLGLDWSIGDDVGYVVGGTVDDGSRVYESVPAFPGGIRGTARAIGWELTLTGVETVVPVLQNGEQLGDSDAG